MASFTIKDLTFTYPQKPKPALDKINLEISDGEFIAICGKSGCGKSTLLRHLKTVLTPHGTRSGQILFNGRELHDADARTQSSEIGYVLQSPENQIVTDKVWHELAFGLESLGVDKKTIRLRVAEMASFFGIQTWFMKNISELSGGQKQLLNLASVMAMQPGVLILDEPTSQLDPIAASEFLETVKKINRELGTTIIITEHRLEEVFPMADRAVVMDDARIIADDTPQAVGEQLKGMQHDMFVSMPSPMQIYAGVENALPCPLTVRDGRNWLNGLFADKTINQKECLSSEKRNDDTPVAVSMDEVWFRYEKNAPDVIRDLSMQVKQGDFYCVLGGNGTGKTTMLTLISKINRPYRGKVRLYGKEVSKYSDQELFTNNLGVLPQNPQALFVKKTVELDLQEALYYTTLSAEEKEQKVRDIAQLVEIEELLGMHPYDLSGGEQQRAALAKVLLLEPKLLLLDEPTKGLDNHFKAKLAGILKALNARGVTVIMVSHDIEFCAKYADTCAMFFGGGVVASGTAKEFFSGNSFYTTAANRMSRHIFKGAVTNEDVIKLCNMNL